MDGNVSLIIGAITFAMAYMVIKMLEENRR